MAGRLRDDHIRFVLSLDAKGVQSEIVNFSSRSKDLTNDNKKLGAELKLVEKDMDNLQKQISKLAASGDTTSEKFNRLKQSFTEVADDANDLRSQISANEKSITAFDKKSDELIRTLQVEDMTMNQLKQRAKELEMQLHNTSRSTDPAAYNQLEKELNTVRSRMGELGKGAQDAEKSFDLFSSASVKALGLFVAALAIAHKGFETLKDLMLSNKATGIEFQAMMDGVGNAVDYAKTAIANMDFTNFIEGMSEAYRIGKEVSVMLGELFERENSYKLTSAPIKAELEEMKTQLRDVNLSHEERLKIGEQIIAKTKELAALEKDVKQQAVDANIKLLESHTNLTEVERDYVITNYNANRQQIIYAKELIVLENKKAQLKGGTTQVEIQMNAQITESLNKQIEAMRNSADFSEVAYNSIKKYMMGSNDLIGGFVTSFEALLQVDINTNRELRRTETMMNRLKKSSTGSGESAAKKALQKQKKDQDKMLEALETKHQERVFAIKEQYKKGEIGSEAELNRKVFSEEQAYYLLRENALKEFIGNTSNEELKSSREKQLAQTRNKQVDDELKFRKQLEKIILDADPAAKEKAAYEERLQAVDLYDAAMLKEKGESGEALAKLTAEQLKALELLEEQHEKNLRDIRVREEKNRKADAERQFEEKYGEEFKKKEDDLAAKDQETTFQVGIGTLSGNAAFEAELAVHNMRLQMIREEIEARKEAGLESDKLNKELTKREMDLTKLYVKEYNTRKQEFAKYGQDLGAVIGNVISGQQDALQAFSNIMLDILFDTLTQIVNAKIAEATAVAIAEQAKAAAIAAAQPDSVITFGATAVARTAAIGAIIMGALATAKTALKGMIGKRKETSSSSSQSSAPSTGSISVKKPCFAEGGVHEGYTGGGSKYDIKGYFPDGQPYHAGEYIIPKDILFMPDVVPMVRQIEQMRRRKSNDNPLPEGFAEGGYKPDQSVLSGIDPELVYKLTHVLDKLYEDGVRSVIGITEYQAKLELYNKEKEIFTKKG